jgi:hypothetical protein
LPEEVDSSLFSHHELHDGDVVQAGSTFIHVEIT